MISCKICDKKVIEIVSFGKMPIANGFLSEDQFKDEYFFELKTGFCPNCGMFQLIEQLDREKMFNKNYPFFSGTSKSMMLHFQEFAECVKNDYIGSGDPFVVEIGSNDGTMLRHFADAGIRHLGIEPSANVAQVAIKDGINTISKFFDEECTKNIVSEYGRADAFLGANVMCHIPYLDTNRAKLLHQWYGADYVVVSAKEHVGDIEGLIERFHNKEYRVLEIPVHGTYE